MWGYHDGMGWWMVFGGLWMLLFWAGLVALIVWGVLALARRSGNDREDPVRIAERRYASGEITRQQLDDIRSALRR